MKKLLITGIFTLVLFSVQQAGAQTAPQPPTPAGAPEGPGRPHKARPHERGFTEAVTVSGKVVRTDANPDYVYDGFTMLQGSDSIFVKFAPHMGAQLIPYLKSGSAVSVTGSSKIDPEGKKDLRMISININGKTITDTPPAETTTAVAADNFVSGSGKLISAQTGRRGEVNGYLLSDKTILRLPPGAGENFTATAGTSISYTGMQKTLKSGEVSTDNYKIIRCKTVTVNGKQYIAE